MAAQPVILNVNGIQRQYLPEQNPNAYNANGTLKSRWEFIPIFGKVMTMSFRVLQLFDRIARIAAISLKNAGSALASTFEVISSKLTTAWQFMAIPRLFEVVPKMCIAFTNWFQSPVGPDSAKSRDRWQKVHDIADGAGTCGLVASLLTMSNSIKNMADVPTLVSDATDLVMANEDWSLAKAHLDAFDALDPNNVNADVRDRFVYTVRDAFIRMVKSTSSVASGILALMVVSLGGPVLPALALIVVGLITTISAISAYFYKETRTQMTVNFYPQNIAAAVAG